MARQVKIETERESRRIKEQRDIVTGKPPRFHNPSNPSKNRKQQQRSNKGDGSKIQSQMKADLNQMNQDIQTLILGARGVVESSSSPSAVREQATLVLASLATAPQSQPRFDKSSTIAALTGTLQAEEANVREAAASERIAYQF